jgi:transketolase
MAYLDRPTDPQFLDELCRQMRRDILRMVYGVQSGHPGGSLGCVEFFATLFFQFLEHNPEAFDMDGHNEDIFILSNGHISPVYYSVLARSGYFPIEELATFRKLNSRLQGHPATHEGLPGVRVATGSLGQGVSVAVGAALAKRLNGDPHRVFVLTGDGELQEGQIWEALLFAAHNKVDNLILTVDLNFKQIDGDTRDVLSTNELVSKFLAFNWQVIDLFSGNDLLAVRSTLQTALMQSGKGRPVAILMRTKMGNGVDFMENDFNWHGKAPNAEQFARAMAQLPETSLGDY